MKSPLDSSAFGDPSRTGAPDFQSTDTLRRMPQADSRQQSDAPAQLRDEDDLRPGASQTSGSMASPLGRLRGLMTPMGIQNLYKEAEARKTHPPEHAILDQPDTPNASVLGQTETSPREIVAAPEIIPPHGPEPPQSLAGSVRDKEPAAPAKPPRVSEWDEADEIQTLPSWRGQYRRRRYRNS